VEIDTKDLGPFAEYIGLKIDTAGPDGIEAHWSARPELHQPYGLVHGGVHCSVVETLASVAGAVWLGDRGRVVGVNNNTDFFRSATEGRFRSVATPLHRGRSQQVWVVETRDESDRLVSRGQVRLQNLS
jgi:1,4-dihydroxy-2-naphthoyl-CoA hydrolase